MMRTRSTSRMFRISFLHYSYLLFRPLSNFKSDSIRRIAAPSMSLSLSFARSAVLHSTERTNYRKSLKDARSRLPPMLESSVDSFLGQPKQITILLYLKPIWFCCIDKQKLVSVVSNWFWCAVWQKGSILIGQNHWIICSILSCIPIIAIHPLTTLEYFENNHHPLTRRNSSSFLVQRVCNLLRERRERGSGEW